MKFIHTGDIHYGMNPDSDRPWSRERAQAVRDSLSAIVRAAAEDHTDLLLVAGDLFHRQPLVRELKEAAYLFGTIPETSVVIIAGNHDYIRQSSAVLSFSWPENVRFITEDTLTCVSLDRIGTEVYGFSYHTKEITENVLSGISVPDSGRIRLLLVHGGDAKHLPFDVSELCGAGFAYCALGHIHKPQILKAGKAAYCGSPEPLDLTETGPHGFYKGEINDVTRELVSLTFVPVSKLQYISLAANVTPESTNTELLMSIGDEIRRRGLMNIYRLRIRGMRDPDAAFDLDVLKSRYRIAEILDESEPKYDFPKLFREHSSDMIGFFIRELYRPDMSPLDKKALYYGVNALLRTTDERSGKP